MRCSRDAPIRSAAQAAVYLEGLINVEKRPGVAYERLGLEPVWALLERLGNPERGLRVIHIAGSKGKGSTALFAEALLGAAGLRVGTFTSPHLESWTERFRIGGDEVAGERLARAVDTLRPHVDALLVGDPRCRPTYFDAATATALVLFREAEVDCAVLEVGLGGRLDSTNVVVPAVTCVTSIELEHTLQLGTTLRAIALEKAGIVKAGVPMVTGALPGEAAAAVAERARACGTEVAALGRDFRVEARDAAPGLRVQIHDGPVGVEARLRVRGAHQAGNAALALACVRRARVLDDAELARVAAVGLEAAVLPGRVEILGRAPWIVIDSAHTAASARALADALAALPQSAVARTHFVLSISAGKNVSAVLRALLHRGAIVTVTCAEPARSLPPDEIAAAVRRAAPDVAPRIVPDPRLAVRSAREALSADDCLCVAGSVYLAGIARRVLGAALGDRGAVGPRCTASAADPERAGEQAPRA